MKRLRNIILAISIILPMIITLMYFSTISTASSFTYNYDRNGAPPFTTTINGRSTEVYGFACG